MATEQVYERHKIAFMKVVDEYFETDNLQLIPEMVDHLESIALANDTSVSELRQLYFIAYSDQPDQEE